MHSVLQSLYLYSFLDSCPELPGGNFSCHFLQKNANFQNWVGTRWILFSCLFLGIRNFPGIPGISFFQFPGETFCITREISSQKTIFKIFYQKKILIDNKVHVLGLATPSRINEVFKNLANTILFRKSCQKICVSPVININFWNHTTFLSFWMFYLYSVLELCCSYYFLKFLYLYSI